jgi:hypothetical protein
VKKKANTRKGIHAVADRILADQIAFCRPWSDERFAEDSPTAVTIQAPFERLSNANALYAFLSLCAHQSFLISQAPPTPQRLSIRLLALFALEKIEMDWNLSLLI